jgi:hypothetical protein
VETKILRHPHRLIEQRGENTWNRVRQIASHIRFNGLGYSTPHSTPPLNPSIYPSGQLLYPLNPYK